MDKKDWEKSTEMLRNMKEKMEKDLEEITFSLKCYEEKINSFKE